MLDDHPLNTHTHTHTLTIGYWNGNKQFHTKVPEVHGGEGRASGDKCNF